MPTVKNSRVYRATKASIHPEAFSILFFSKFFLEIYLLIMIKLHIKYSSNIKRTVK